MSAPATDMPTAAPAMPGWIGPSAASMCRCAGAPGHKSSVTPTTPSRLQNATRQQIHRKPRAIPHARRSVRPAASMMKAAPTPRAADSRKREMSFMACEAGNRSVANSIVPRQRRVLEGDGKQPRCYRPSMDAVRRRESVAAQGAAVGVHLVHQYLHVLRVDFRRDAVAEVEHVAGVVAVAVEHGARLAADHVRPGAQDRGVEVALQRDLA